MHLMYNTIQKFGVIKFIKTLIQQELFKLIKSDKSYIVAKVIWTCCSSKNTGKTAFNIENNIKWL